VGEIFDFFTDAYNLQTLTPAWVNFQILPPKPIRLRAGALIDYRLRIHDLPVRGQTEITVWEPTQRFVDEQKRGPYRLWIHEHRFTAQNGGTLCSDHVRYAALGGELVNRLFVRRDVEKIFAFRRRQLEEGFGHC
jgi:ligand-binding SRPBCC domain-containing protein